ncbi:MAG: energy transducer TonB [Polyangia bacterium]
MPDIADAVLGVAAPQRTRRLSWTVIAALFVHAMVLGGMHRIARRPAAAELPARPEVAIDLAAVQPRSPPPPAATPDRAPAEHRATGARTPSARAARAPAAAAATVIARAADSNAPVDLTADAVVTGNAVAYAGGVTAADGAGHSPGAESSAGPPPATPAAGAGRASPVSLASEDWSCPWPAEADADQIDEQTVVLRVVVNATGDPQSAVVLADPGHGFGAAARTCAMRTHFSPARDAGGRPVSAASPPIRVRFTR